MNQPRTTRTECDACDRPATFKLTGGGDRYNIHNEVCYDHLAHVVRDIANHGAVTVTTIAKTTKDSR